MAVTLIWGLGLSGWSALTYLHAKGERVQVYDDQMTPANFAKAKQLLGADNILESLPCASAIVRIIVSPGVSVFDERYQTYLRQGVTIITDVQLFLENYSGQVIAVTGTNGKSSLVAMLAFIGQQLGLNIVAAGNIGQPALTALASEIVVLELSSFHLAHGLKYRFALGVVLELTPDHLNWHNSFQHYKAAKHRLPKYAKKALVVRDSKLFNECGQQIGGSSQTELLQKIAQILQWPIAKVFAHAMKFTPLPHRQQAFTASARTWINDSKATNASATLYAIKHANSSQTSKLVLILAGIHKGWSHQVIDPCVQNLIVVGEFAKWPIEYHGDYHEVGDVKAAITLAQQLTTAGDIILFSPGGASFDQFSNFAERGEYFIEQVKCLS